MVTAIIVAAGKGERLSNETDKPFVKLNGRPMISYSLTLFEEIREIDSVILVVSSERVTDASSLVSRRGFHKVKEVVAGGATRQESASNGLAVLPHATRTVLVHDAARPLISKDKVRQLVAMGKTVAIIPALPVSDTVKEVKGGCVLHTIDRRRFYTVQTPQVFPKDVILAAYRRAKHFGMVGSTDDAALAEAAGFPVQVIEGERTNIKITYPEDLVYAAVLLKQMQGGATPPPCGRTGVPPVMR